MTSHEVGGGPVGSSDGLRWGGAGVSTPEEALGLPVGTVTFLLSDVAGSTQMWEREHRDAMRAAIVRHYEILGEAVERHGGVRPQEQGEGDSIVAAFARPTDALAAATDAQVALHAEPWPTGDPLRVRIAVHTGEAQLRDDANYAGRSIVRTARLRSLAHGGQVLVSGVTRDLVVDEMGSRFELRSLGDHHLRDLGRAEHVWQLIVPGLPDLFPPPAAAAVAPNTLPTSLSSFIGRDAEIEDLAGLVQAERLVTVTGTGGAGKTRLAAEVGGVLLEQFPAGVWWVELAPLDERTGEAAVRAPFGVSEGATTTVEEAVAFRLADEPCLLILDNCEHVADAMRDLVARLLSRAPSLHILATSRVMLGVPGECTWRVPPLHVPEGGDGDDPIALAESDAVRLFCDRARRSRPNFELTEANAPAVAAICARLDGIPLSIELAAARCRMLDPQRILTGLSDSLALLAGGSKVLLARQQTLDASITWSYDLLSTTEQTLLRRLAPFVDGWTLDAAEAICPDGPLTELEVFDAMDRLVDHCLVQVSDSAGALRFHMLETVRQYANRRLAEDPAEHRAVRRRHAQHFTDWAIGVGDQLIGDGDDPTFDAVTIERSNILAAAEHTIDLGDPSRACHALVALAPILELHLWARTSPIVLALLDRLEPAVPVEDLWRVHFLRQKMWALRGNPLDELASLAAMEEAARAVGDHIGVGIARFMTLSVISIVDAGVLDEMWEVADGLEQHSPGWAAMGRSYVAAVSSFQGRLVLAERALGSPDRTSSNPARRSARDLARGLVAFSRGDAEEALVATASARAARYLSRNAANLAAGIHVVVAAELGRDIVAEVEPALRRQSLVDGNPMESMTADGMLAIHHLLADDLEAAAEALQRSKERASSLGMAGAWPMERYVLVACGVGEHDDVLSLPAGPTIASSNARARGEQHLQRGDIAGAVAGMQQSLGLAQPERALRSVLLNLEFLGRILTQDDRHLEAARLYGTCRRFRDDHRLVHYPCMQRLLDDAIGASRAALGDEAFQAAFLEGRAQDLEAAADGAARVRVTRSTGVTGWSSLTPTELRVAELVSEGLSNPEVAKLLLMGTETVKTHLSRVFAKLGVANRRMLILEAGRRAAEQHR